MLATLIWIFINPETKLLRSGWRFMIFAVLAPLPQLLASGGGGQAPSVFEIGLAMIVVYIVLVAWVAMISWLCLKFLDQLSFGALGVGFYRGWWREVLLGCVVGIAMMTAVIILQVVGKGTQLHLNPNLTNQATLVMVAQGALVALVFLILAGSFEELLFRGYGFQTLLRGVPTIVPLMLFSIFFGWAHWTNPNRTLFSTANTVLAGIWLAVGYLKTRSLWFPIGLHFMWNWMLGIFYGLPVSGIRLTSNPIFISTSDTPVWLTGGNYGSEGGAAATVVLIITTIILWRARWLSVAPEMQALLEPRHTVVESPIHLHLETKDEEQRPDGFSPTPGPQPPTPT